MKFRSTKSIAWTITLAVLVAVGLGTHFSWPELWIPGALLMWYGMVVSAPQPRLATPHRGRTTLH